MLSADIGNGSKPTIILFIKTLKHWLPRFYFFFQIMCPLSFYDLHGPGWWAGLSCGLSHVLVTSLWLIPCSSPEQNVIKGITSLQGKKKKLCSIMIARLLGGDAVRCIFQGRRRNAFEQNWSMCTLMAMLQSLLYQPADHCHYKEVIKSNW